MSKLQELEDTLASSELLTAEWGIYFDTATDCCWSGEVRITPTPGNLYGPDESRVFFVAGKTSPEDCAFYLLPTVRKFISNLQTSKVTKRHSHAG